MNNSHLSWVERSVFSSEPFVRYRALLPELDWDNWDQPRVKAMNVDLIQTRSSICFEIGQNKGGWLFPEKVYTDDPTFVNRAPEHSEDLDRFTLRQPMCHSLAARLRFISGDLLPRYIRAALNKKPSLRIGSFGSGTGRDVMLAMKGFGPEVSAECYDVDERAFEVGRAIAWELGVHDRVRFILEDLTKLKTPACDIALLIGIICPLPDTLACRIIRAVVKSVSPGGRLIISSSSERMESADPLSRFLIEYVADWHLQFRHQARMDALIASTGLEIVESTAEPSGYNRLVVAAVDSSET